MSLEFCLGILNDETKSMSLKYQTFYSFIYQDGRDLDYKKLKSLYDNLEENTFTSIIKVDMAYLMSISKNKEFIP